MHAFSTHSRRQYTILAYNMILVKKKGNQKPGPTPQTECSQQTSLCVCVRANNHHPIYNANIHIYYLIVFARLWDARANNVRFGTIYDSGRFFVARNGKYHSNTKEKLSSLRREHETNASVVEAKWADAVSFSRCKQSLTPLSNEIISHLV